MHTELATRLPAYRAPRWLRGGHAQSIWPKFIQPPPPAYRRELLPDSTGQTTVAYDFIDAADPAAPLVVLFHGLEGDSRSHYARALMHAVRRRGWHGVVAHFRGCGGVSAQRFYHSGDSGEVAHMLSVLSQRYARLYAVGVSLGGNALAKYLGEQGRAVPLRAAACVSVPLDLAAAADALGRGLSRLIYTPYFLRTLMAKVPYPPPHNIRSLNMFDNAYTAPLHGFADAQDYYARSSALPYLAHIALPTLIINAQNDPFFPAAHLPRAEQVSPAVTLVQPQHGGHAGFVGGSGRGSLNWLPENLLAFFRQHP